MDISHITITNSPRDGVGAGQAEPTVGVGSQALPIPGGEYDDYSGELGGLLEGGVRKTNISISVVWGKNPVKTKQSVTQVIHRSKRRKTKVKEDSHKSELLNYCFEGIEFNFLLFWDSRVFQLW